MDNKPKDPAKEAGVTGYYPKTGDEFRFYIKHLIDVVKNADHTKQDHVFNGSVKPHNRETDKHGYNPGSDVEVYESEGREGQKFTHDSHPGSKKLLARIRAGKDVGGGKDDRYHETGQNTVKDSRTGEKFEIRHSPNKANPEKGKMNVHVKHVSGGMRVPNYVYSDQDKPVPRFKEDTALENLKNSIIDRLFEGLPNPARKPWMKKGARVSTPSGAKGTIDSHSTNGVHVKLDKGSKTHVVYSDVRKGPNNRPTAFVGEDENKIKKYLDALTGDKYGKAKGISTDRSGSEIHDDKGKVIASFPKTDHGVEHFKVAQAHFKKMVEMGESESKPLSSILRYEDEIVADYHDADEVIKIEGDK